MKRIIFLLIALFIAQGIAFSQKKLNLTNAVVVGMFDRKDERFQMEIVLAELLLENSIKTKVSLNFLKEGADIVTFASDSIQDIVKNAGYDTYILFSVRGYETRFKPATIHYSLEEELSLGHLFPVYREEASSVTFEYKIYKGQEMIGYSLVKVSSPSKEGMIKKYRKKMDKIIKTEW